MLFGSREEVKKVVSLWSISQNKEFKVYESKIRLWYVCAFKKKNLHNVKDYMLDGCTQLLWFMYR